MQIAVESKGKHKIFQNQAALVNLNLSTTIHDTKTMNSKTPIAKNHFRFAMIKSL